MNMDCAQIEREDLIERYLTGMLGADEQKALISHSIGCPRCRERLQVSRLLQEELDERSLVEWRVAPEEARPQIGRWAWLSAAALAIAVVALGIWWQFGGRAGASVGPGKISPALVALSEFEPPLFIPLALRGAADEAVERFRAGMARYQAGDFTGAVAVLRSAAELNPQGAAIRFFLGVCCLLSGRTSEGITELQATIGLGDPAYLEEAHFFLAKGLIRQGRVRAARRELKAVIGLGSKLKTEAARLLTELE
jgi:tetratricopeptide (TPR) repeat protein